MEKEYLRREVLLTLRGKEEYGYNVAKILASKGNKVHLGYLYETLGEMESEEIVKSRWEKGVPGPKRRFYSITRKGEFLLRTRLKESIDTIMYFYNDYLFHSNVNDLILQEINETYPLESTNVIVWMVTFPHPEIEIVASRTLSFTKRARLYVIKPPQLEVKVNLPNVIVLDGTQEDVPLKEGLADVIWVQSVFSTSIPRCVKELRRVVKTGGIVCFGVPQLHMAEAKEPLDVGGYVQKMVYELMRSPGIIRSEIIEQEILKCFAKTHLHRIGPTGFFLSHP